MSTLLPKPKWALPPNAIVFSIDDSDDDEAQSVMCGAFPTALIRNEAVPTIQDGSVTKTKEEASTLEQGVKIELQNGSTLTTRATPSACLIPSSLSFTSHSSTSLFDSYRPSPSPPPRPPYYLGHNGASSASHYFRSFPNSFPPTHLNIRHRDIHHPNNHSSRDRGDNSDHCLQREPRSGRPLPPCSTRWVDGEKKPWHNGGEARLMEFGELKLEPIPTVYGDSRGRHDLSPPMVPARKRERGYGDEGGEKRVKRHSAGGNELLLAGREEVARFDMKRYTRLVNYGDDNDEMGREKLLERGSMKETMALESVSAASNVVKPSDVSDSKAIKEVQNSQVKPLNLLSTFTLKASDHSTQNDPSPPKVVENSSITPVKLTNLLTPLVSSSGEASDQPQSRTISPPTQPSSPTLSAAEAAGYPLNRSPANGLNLTSPIPVVFRTYLTNACNAFDEEYTRLTTALDDEKQKSNKLQQDLKLTTMRNQALGNTITNLRSQISVFKNERDELKKALEAVVKLTVEAPMGKSREQLEGIKEGIKELERIGGGEGVLRVIRDMMVGCGGVKD